MESTRRMRARGPEVTTGARFRWVREGTPAALRLPMRVMVVEGDGRELRQLRRALQWIAANEVHVADIRLVVDALRSVNPQVIVGDLVSLCIAAIVRPNAKRVWLSDGKTLLSPEELEQFGISRVLTVPIPIDALTHLLR